MKSIMVLSFVLLFFLFIIILPFRIRMMCHINFLNMKGFYGLKIWRFNIFSGKFYIDELGKFKVNNSMEFSKNYNKDFVKQLSLKILGQIDVSKVEIYFTGGISENSFSSAMLCGGISSFVKSLYSYLSQKYKFVELYENVEPTFGQDNIELTINFCLNISILQILISIISASFANNKLKERENER